MIVKSAIKYIIILCLHGDISYCDTFTKQQDAYHFDRVLRIQKKILHANFPI